MFSGILMIRWFVGNLWGVILRFLKTEESINDVTAMGSFKFQGKGKGVRSKELSDKFYDIFHPLFDNVKGFIRKFLQISLKFLSKTF